VGGVRELVRQVAVEARRRHVERPAGRRRGLERQIDQRQEHLRAGVAGVLPLFGLAPGGVPEGAGGAARAAVLDRVEREELRRLAVRRRGDHPVDRVDLVGQRAAHVRHHAVLVVGVGQLDGLGPPRVEVDHGRATQPEGVRRDVRL